MERVSITSGGRVVFLVSRNIHKFNEARRVLTEHGLTTALLRLKIMEIQDDNIENIAKARAEEAVRKTGLPIVVEDAGLFIKTLRGFPGPYSSYVYRTIGTQGILKLMNGVKERGAYFHSVVVFCHPNGEPKCFHGKVEGKISYNERGNFGFGFDPIFEPLEASGRTFAEMVTAEKNRYSHRARAFQKFAQWYLSTQWVSSLV